jgi:branched-chain amino acid transport system substrate-binding protein
MARRIAIALLTAFLCLPASADPIRVKIGVLTDMSSLYSDGSGQGSVEAAKMAAEDFSKANSEVNVEIVSADHQNKPDIAASVARAWYESDAVDAIADVPASSTALAVSSLTRAANKVLLATNAAAMTLTGEQCSPNTVVWTYDSWGFAHGTAETLVKRGLDSWFFITADYVYGHTTEKLASEVVRAAGGKVLGSVKHPFNNADFSSALLSAKASGAKVIGLANAGGDAINTIKQAREFGVTSAGQTIAALAIFITDVHALGLEVAQGLTLTTWFYWDQNDATRAFAKRFADRRGGRRPAMGQAGTYSAILLYLEAVKKLGTASDGAAVIAAMRDKGEYEDPLFGRTHVRLDGRAPHPMYLAEVKTPSESKGPWDYYKILATIPPERAARPLAESKAAGCNLVP